MPRELICPQPGALEWRSYEDKPLESNQVRVKPHHSAAKHGTEMAFYQGYANPRGSWDRDLQLFHGEEPASPYPWYVGNMFVGTVTEVGDAVTKWAEGDEVFGWASFRETHTMAEDAWNLRALPPRMSWENAVCIDPAQFALGAVRDGHVRVGDAVAVFGLGAIGLMAVQLARISGAVTIVALDPLPTRRELAGELGADVVLDPTDCDAGLEIKKATERRGADVCIDFSGARMALQHCIRGVAFGGTVVCGAFPKPYDQGLDLGAEAHMNIPNLVFSRACSQPDRDHPRWDVARNEAVCTQLLAGGFITGLPIVTPVVPFDDLLDEYPKIPTSPDTHIKLGAVHG